MVENEVEERSWGVEPLLCSFTVQPLAHDGCLRAHAAAAAAVLGYADIPGNTDIGTRKSTVAGFLMKEV